MTPADDEAIRALVTRLARPNRSGGKVIERAAILAEGADFRSVIGWIVAHGGEPEAAVASPSGGLHQTRSDGGRGGDPAPRRFVLPSGELA
ncbi:MAG: hypothetical protein QOG41_154 [Thermoleophilaceae bacterium]|nr:hypothetical protein [Thermoleophilaceae bacterium]MEA2352180.1 hypothetical protein [Thermoleophilaceae bacterium]MEA2387381.1 hypothetical protein [Thermoleophilaceae bacterium]